MQTSPVKLQESKKQHEESPRKQANPLAALTTTSKKSDVKLEAASQPPQSRATSPVTKAGVASSPQAPVSARIVVVDRLARAEQSLGVLSVRLKESKDREENQKAARVQDLERQLKRGSEKEQAKLAELRSGRKNDAESLERNKRAQETLKNRSAISRRAWSGRRILCLVMFGLHLLMYVNVR